MMKKILFSPIGFSDPTRGNYDGPFLHIIRKYSPQKAVIFLTKETAEFDEIDNRYEIMAKHVKKDIVIEKEVFKDIIKANDFQIFDQYFKKNIYKIKKQNPDSEILINITSGTTQMSASLYMLASTLTFPVKLIQVDTHEKAANRTRPVCRDYNIEAEKQNLMDNLEEDEIENRCHEIIPENVIRHQLIQSIESHIKAYDYDAAKKLAEMDNEFFSVELKDLIQMAKLRSELDHRSAEIIAQKYNYDLYPVKSSDVKNKFEYLLYLQKVQVKEHLNDFSRAISPILLNLFLDLLYIRAGIDMKSNYCTINNKTGVYYLRRNLLNKEPFILKNYYDKSQFWEGEFKEGYLSVSNTLPMILYSADRDENINRYKDRCILLKSIEEKIRNSAAHDIICVNEETYEKEAEISSAKTLKILKEVFEFVYDKNKKNITWNSYDLMNEYIIHKLKEDH